MFIQKEHKGPRNWIDNLEGPMQRTIEMSLQKIEKETLGRPRRRQDNSRIELKEIGVDTRNWNDSAQDRDYWRSL